MNLIKRLCDTLSPLKRPDVRELKEALAAIGCTPELVAPYVSEPERLPYGRNVLYRSDEVEAIVVHLPARSETYIHDHGSSAGCALVVEGIMQNAMFQVDERGEAAYVAEFRMREGQTILAPKGQIHQMSNPGARRTVSLHLYSPPLSGAKTYKRAEQYVLDYVI
jgi:cysteine dioxygenase